jgi:hypothetical protein
MAEFVSTDKLPRKKPVAPTPVASGTNGETKTGSSSGGAQWADKDDLVKPSPVTPAVVTTDSYSLVLLDNRTVNVSQLNTTENLEATKEFEKIMKSARTSNLGVKGVSNRPLIIKTLNEDWSKISKVVNLNEISEPTHFDFQTAGVVSNTNNFVKRVTEKIGSMCEWLNVFVNTFGHLTVAKAHAIECDDSLKDIKTNQIATANKLEIMMVRYNTQLSDVQLKNSQNKPFFSGTLRGKFKTLRSYTEKVRAAGMAEGSRDIQAREARTHIYKREMQSVLDYAIAFHDKYQNHIYGQVTIKQLKEELLEGRRGIQVDFDTSFNTAYVKFMGDDYGNGEQKE